MVEILHPTIAEKLINIHALKINTQDPFIWSSGIESPIYCDNRLTMSYPEVRRLIAKAFAWKIDRNKIDVIAGCATAGIPHAAFVSEQLNLPMIYVRSKPKGHGLENMIEGHVNEGGRVVVIEDLISTGQSAIKAAQALRDQGFHVEKVLSIFTYGLKEAKDNFEQVALKYESLVTFDDVVSVLVKQGELTEREQEGLLNWRNALILK
ncbi:orotate phosphoribosyltransferase [Alkalibacillus silvisoli]|uniref:Orotate phosphoribosyltransferase n=1 Tax=Alkalibacillus silvisoli TaxID=392823 RepID=A0ABN0ZWG8_9BACI